MALTEERFLELMKRMNNEQIINIEKKVADQLDIVKKDLSGAISKVSDRQDNMEEEQKAMKTQMVAMQEQLKEIQTLAQVQTVSAVEKNSVTQAELMQLLCVVLQSIKAQVEVL